MHCVACICMVRRCMVRVPTAGARPLQGHVHALLHVYACVPTAGACPLQATHDRGEIASRTRAAGATIVSRAIVSRAIVSRAIVGRAVMRIVAVSIAHGRHTCIPALLTSHSEHSRGEYSRGEHGTRIPVLLTRSDRRWWSRDLRRTRCHTPATGLVRSVVSTRCTVVSRVVRNPLQRRTTLYRPLQPLSTPCRLLAV